MCSAQSAENVHSCQNTPAPDVSCSGSDKALPTRIQDKFAQLASKCRKCELHKTRTQVVWGSGSDAARIVFIGEAPGRTEDEGGQPFIGAAGKVLDELLAAADLKRDDIYITNVVKCRPPKNRNPMPAEIDVCSKYLKTQIPAIGPSVIVTLGTFATRYVLQRKDSMAALQGRLYQSKDYLILPLYHPAATIYDRTKREPFLAAAPLLKKLLAEESAGDSAEGTASNHLSNHSPSQENT